MHRFLNLLRGRRGRLERDLDRELRFHIEGRVADLIRSGSSVDEAHRQARRDLGGRAQIQEQVRDTWFWRWLADTARDVRFSARALVRRPVFTLTAVISIAIGIGASAAIFSLADQLILRTLPVRDPERLVLLNWNGSSLAPGLGSGNLLSSRLCRDLQARDFFEGVFCRHPVTVTLRIDAHTELVGAEVVTGSYFPVLGVQPALGRLLDRSDDLQPGAHPVAVLSYDYWRNRLDGRADVVGRTVAINGATMTVVGVASASFRGVDVAETPAVWLPESMKLQALPSWRGLLENQRARWLHVFGRLKPGTSIEGITASLQPWFKLLQRDDMTLADFPPASAEQRTRYLASTLTTIPAAGGRSEMRATLTQPLWVLLAGTALLHLLASLNVASLFLARGAARTREVRMRLALGASRRRILGLLAADSVLVALAGGAAGLVVAPVVLHALLSFLPQEAAGTAFSATIDSRVFLFALVASLVTTMLCGAALLWQASRVPLVASLRERHASGHVGLRKTLVAGQIAFTLVLLVGSGLFVRTLASLNAKGPGFSTTNLVTFGIDPRQNGYSNDDAKRLVREVVDSVRSTPSVKEASFTGIDLLMGGSWSLGLTIDGDTRITTDRDVHLNTVSENFFTMMGVRLIAGRGFEPRDGYAPGESGPNRVVIVNEPFARRYFGTASPIGRRIGLSTRPDVPTDIEIIGVVSHFAYRDIREESEQAFLLGDNMESGTLYVKVDGSPEAAFAAMRSAVDRVDPTLPLQSLRTFDDQVARSLMTERMLATLSSGFSSIALMLSVVGLYGVLAFVVTARTREIGIRLALGATRGSALWHVVRDALVLISIGAAIAVPCIWWIGRFVEAQLYGVTPLDSAAIASAVAILTTAALAGSLLPAWRAASVKPTEALRSE